MDASLLNVISPTDIVDYAIWSPEIWNLIQVELAKRQITHMQIAQKIHTAVGTVSCWFSRKAIPADKLFGVVAAIGGARFWMQVQSKMPHNPFYVRYLDKTNESPLAAAGDLLDAAEAAMQSIPTLTKTIRHKNADFTEEEITKILAALDSCAELHIFSQMLLVRSEEVLGVPVHDVMLRLAERMEDEGYCTKDIKKKSPVLAHRRLQN